MKDYSKDFKAVESRNRDMDIRTAYGELDELFKAVKEYRNSKEYWQILKFCSKFKYLAPFNALMVRIQRPGCTLLLTAKQWERRYHRTLKPNARPVVVLSYMPVSYLFDISDTVATEGYNSTNEQILNEIDHQFNTKEKVSEKDLNILIENLSVLGIAYDGNFRAGGDFGAQIELLKKPIAIEMPLKKNHSFKYKVNYLLSVNSTLETGAQYTAIMHELGHFFCHHLPSPIVSEQKMIRKLDKKEKEFEAESTAWLVCERLNISNPSEKYLAGYLSQNEKVPGDISLGHIFKAHNEIWKLLFEKQYAKNSYLYRIDKEFKGIVDNILGGNRNKPATPIQQTLF